MSKKITFKIFDIMEAEEEGKYLTEMHSKGWKFVKAVLPGFYHFESCEPENVVYQLDYNPTDSKDREEYLKMFADCGWEHIFDFVGFAYFTKPEAEMKGEEEIFNDDNSKNDMLKKIMGKRFAPILLLYIIVVIPQLISSMATGHNLGSLRIMWWVIFVIYTLIVISVSIKYIRFLKKANLKK